MKRFVLADGDVFYQSPVVVGNVTRNVLGYWSFDIVFKDKINRQYQHRFKREVERERERLLSFEW